MRLQSLLFFSITIFSVSGHCHNSVFDDYQFDDSNGGSSEPLATASARLGSSALPAVCSDDGLAGGYPCRNIDLLSVLKKADMGAADVDLSDIWGWSDPVTGAEIAIVGLEDGTSFVDVTDPSNLVYLGKLATHQPRSGSRFWRDIKVYNDHAFIVADGSANVRHGMQVFDLTTLRDIVSPPRRLRATAHEDGFGIAHNIAINEDTGYAYVVGSNRCSGGLYMIDISNPVEPEFSGCFSSDGYVHDAQCVVYNGPDARYSGREICFAYNEDTITIVDVTNKANPRQLSRTGYPESSYTHQGWLLDENQSIVIMNDEGDELDAQVKTTTFVYDVSNLREIKQLGTYVADTEAIDHNLYTRDGYIFESNYRAGLRILAGDGAAAGNLTEVAWFDVVPRSDSAQFSGAWSSYIYFASGNVMVSDIGRGLFVVRPDWEKINEIDRTPSLSISNVVVRESQRRARLTLSLSRPSESPVLVTAVTRGRSAVAGTDFRNRVQRVRFAPGQTERNFAIDIINDETREAAERFIVRLVNSRNANIDDAIGSVVVRDDD